MRADPKLIEIVKGDRGMISGIRACLQQQCLVSAIALIYSAIDSISALTRPRGQADTTSAQFKDWVNRYMLPQSSLSCMAEELYAARCGIIHTYSPESRIQRKSQGTVKKLIYCWKAGPGADAEIPLPANATVIIVEDLFDRFRMAIDRFFEAIEQESKLASLVNTHRMELLCYRPFEVVTVHVAAQQRYAVERNIADSR